MTDLVNKRVIEELRFQKTALIEQINTLHALKDKAEKESEHLRLFFDFSSSCCLVLDVDAKIVSLNKSASLLLTGTNNDLIDSSFSQFIVQEQLPDFNGFLLKAKQNSGNHTCDFELITDQKKYFFINVSGSFLQNKQQYILTVNDRTVIELAKKKSLKNDAIFYEMQRIGNIGIFQFDLTTHSFELSERVRLLFGFKRALTYSIGQWLDIIHPEDKKMMEIYSAECIKMFFPFNKEYRIISKKNGEVRWISAWGEITFDEEIGKDIMFGVIQDITTSKLVIEKIQSAEIRSHQIFESAKEGILILDAITGQITDANPFLIELIGFDYQELVGKELWEIGVFKNIATSKEAFIELQNKEYIRFEDMPLETKAGNSIAVEFVSNVYIVEQKKVIMCHIRDISDRKKIDEALKVSSQLYLAMFEKNQAVLLLIDPADGKIIDANSAAAEFYGYSLKQLKSMNIYDISTFPEGQATRELGNFGLDGQSYFQFVHKLASGDNCDVEIYTSPLFINGQTMLISTINNITKRIKEEERLKLLNKRIKEVSVLKSQFISTVSHEFRTPLAGILSSVQLLKIYSDSWDREKKEKMYKQIFDAVQHTKALLDDVSLIDEAQNSRSFFRPTYIALIPLINEIIEENLVISETNHQVLLKNNLNRERFFMDPIMIRHILNNLLSNAIKYSSEDKTINLDVDEINNTKIKITLIDQGIGIPENEIEYLLEPFYRASNIDSVKGSGFGMSIVKRFVELHTGTINIESIVNQGTKITIILPFLKEIV
jgi:PAS domain S-box-containing protein